MSGIKSTSDEQGFTFIELLTVIIIVGILTSIVTSNFRVSPQRRVELTAAQITRDLEYARTRALSTRRRVRVEFDEDAGVYTGYLDDDDDGAFNRSAAETQALRGNGRVEFDNGVTFGRGSAPSVPGDTASGALNLRMDRVVFDERGLISPLGAGGSIYITHGADAGAVAAISVSPGGSFKTWILRSGQWR